jgi:hypothetical protein
MEKITAEPAIGTTMAMIVVRDDLLFPALTINIRRWDNNGDVVISNFAFMIRSITLKVSMYYVAYGQVFHLK